MGKNRTYESIFQEAFLTMHRINPEHNSSHQVEDWAIENFMDRVIALGYTGDPEKVSNWWWVINQNGPQSVMVELTPEDINSLLHLGVITKKLVAKFKEAEDKSLVTLP